MYHYQSCPCATNADPVKPHWSQAGVGASAPFLVSPLGLRLPSLTGLVLPPPLPTPQFLSVTSQPLTQPQLTAPSGISGGGGGGGGGASGGSLRAGGGASKRLAPEGTGTLSAPGLDVDHGEALQALAAEADARVFTDLRRQRRRTVTVDEPATASPGWQGRVGPPSPLGTGRDPPTEGAWGV